MIDNFEFSDTKQVRKTILISSFVGLCFKILVKNATGTIEFLGFKIPIEDAHIIPKLVGCLIIFEMVALIIRFADESAREKYKKYLKYIEERNLSEILIRKNDESVPQSLKPNYLKNKRIANSVFFLDIIFPSLLGLSTVIKIFLF